MRWNAGTPVVSDPTGSSRRVSTPRLPRSACAQVCFGQHLIDASKAFVISRLKCTPLKELLQTRSQAAQHRHCHQSFGSRDRSWFDVIVFEGKLEMLHQLRIAGVACSGALRISSAGDYSTRLQSDLHRSSSRCGTALMA